MSQDLYDWPLVYDGTNASWIKQIICRYVNVLIYNILSPYDAWLPVYLSNKNSKCKCVPTLYCKWCSSRWK